MAQFFTDVDNQVGGDVVVTMAAVVGIYNVVTMVIASYSASISGRLTVKNGTTSIFDTDIMVANPAPFVFEGINRLISDIGNAMEVRLYSGGLSISGKLNVLGYTTDTYQ